VHETAALIKVSVTVSFVGNSAASEGGAIELLLISVGPTERALGPLTQLSVTRSHFAGNSGGNLGGGVAVNVR
jgi:hypothetical protein